MRTSGPDRPSVSPQEAESFEDAFLSGRRLYGDDFLDQDLEAWFEDEREGYADLGSSADDGGTSYGYHALNTCHGFRHLPQGRRFRHALGVGSAKAEEFTPISTRIERVTVLEPRDHLIGPPLPNGPTPTYVKPTPNGHMPFADETFDLVLCFGTLHHIPNVSTVLGEIGRVTTADGWALIREPVISMGDWRSARKPGVTKRERGIPRDLFVSLASAAGLHVLRARWCVFPGTPRLGRLLGRPAFDSPTLTVLDALASTATRPLYRYHAESPWQKVRPTSVFLVCTKG
jgi:SAM-dependent methyltransferase